MVAKVDNKNEALQFLCPKCGAAVGTPCVTATGSKARETHTDRINAVQDKKISTSQLKKTVEKVKAADTAIGVVRGTLSCEACHQPIEGDGGISMVKQFDENEPWKIIHDPCIGKLQTGKKFAAWKSSQTIEQVMNTMMGVA